VAAEDIDLLLAAAREAGEIALGYHRHDPRRWQKAGGSSVSEADIAVDRMLAERLRAARPDYGWRSEEEADPVVPGHGRAFIADPIDGTREFLDGGDEWAVSLAVVEAGRPVAAVVHAPALGETYHAVRGGGAFRNGVPIRVSARTALSGARVAGPRRFARRQLEAAGISGSAFRFVPSLAYRLVLAAAGVADISIAGPNAHDWDVAAADLIVSEAGGVFTSFEGDVPNYGMEQNVLPALIAGGKAIVAAARRALAEARHAEGVAR